VRTDIAAVTEPVRRYASRVGPVRVLVMGGSLGAKAINDALPGAMARIAPANRPGIVHQTGKGHCAGVESAYRNAAVDANSVEFIDDVAAALADADVVICRAGALTVSELACAGVASVLIPYPHAVDDHQTGNARFLSIAGAAVLMPQSELSEERLARLIESFTREKLAVMAGLARSMGRSDATRRLADACIEVAA